MAKSSKKSESKSTSGPEAPKKAAAKKTPAKSAVAATGQPMVDTSLSFENAARMIGGKFNSGASKNQQPRQESAMFKQLKAGLNKPHGSAMSNLLDKSHGPDPVKSHPQFKQQGQNQTFGADVSRSGVPRRTPG